MSSNNRDVDAVLGKLADTLSTTRPGDQLRDEITDLIVSLTTSPALRVTADLTRPLEVPGETRGQYASRLRNGGTR